jgi:tripartite-type tricarboxylate transporter receptor subunit TctC
MLYRRSFLTASLITTALPALAQAPWPSKPIKLVVPYAPGGSTDVVGRVIAEYLGQRIGQNIVVENRPGKGASIGTSQVAKAAPDGYTLVMSNIAAFAIAPPLYGDLDYDPVRDFAHISLASFNPSVLVVNPASRPGRSPTTSPMPAPIRTSSPMPPRVRVRAITSSA